MNYLARDTAYDLTQDAKADDFAEKVASNVRAILSGRVSASGATLADCVDSFQYENRAAYDALVAFIAGNEREAA